MRDLTSCPPAGLERRLHAALIDLLVLALPAAATSYAVGRGGLPLALGAAAGALLAAALLLAWCLGVTGATPGTAARGLRVVRADGTGTLGTRRAVLRQAAVLGAWAPLGAGAALLGWTALTDPGGRRRGWHDRLVGSVVLDARGAGAAPGPPPPAETLVNLTTLRLTAPPPLPRSVPVAAAAVPAPAPAPTPAPTPRCAPRWHVRLDTGEHVAVDGPTLVGREPSGPAGVRRVTLADPTVSPTHVQLQVADDGALVLMDRGSAHGTVLLRGAAPRRLVPGRPTTLLARDRLRLGDRTLEVVREP